jgi:3-phosphoshikimate 1-carboxyvinyltransferase
VPNDFSAAAFWLAAGSLHPNAGITMRGVGLNPSRTAAMSILQNMGAHIEVENKRKEGFEPVADLRVSSSSLKSVNIGENQVPNCIDEIPILAVCMLFANGVSVIRGAEELRHKETDRLSAMADLFLKAGADFEEYEDGIRIKGTPDFIPKPAAYSSFDDHRIAMSAAVLSMMGREPSTIRNSDCTAISYPNFWTDIDLLTN